MIGYLIVFFVLFVVFVAVPFGIVLIFLSMHYNRRERNLRNEAEAHRKILESTYDHIWREIKQHCGLSEEQFKQLARYLSYPRGVKIHDRESYNTMLRRFPNSIIAGICGFDKKGYFTAPEGSDEPVQVEFNF